MYACNVEQGTEIDVLLALRLSLRKLLIMNFSFRHRLENTCHSLEIASLPLDASEIERPPEEFHNDLWLVCIRVRKFILRWALMNAAGEGLHNR